MKLHIIGVCGTFMGGIARLAIKLGHQVSGSDANTYPPMSTQLSELGIQLAEGYDEANISDDVDLVLIGNTISRGNPELEYVLSRNLVYTSGPQWLGERVLQGKWVLAVAGTHGKTTTASMLAWILHANAYAPGYLIGGVPGNFDHSASLGESGFFVIEADEYDTAFSDKRSKFLHYRPQTLIINNLEFDHADIFANLTAIQTQFQHLLKIIPTTGQIIHNADYPDIDDVLNQGYWSETQSFGQHADWQIEQQNATGSKFTIKHKNTTATIDWPLIGQHNMANALAAVAAAHHVGVSIDDACAALGQFKSVKRRLERIYQSTAVTVYDDFAHHPTAIRETVTALRASIGDEPLVAVLEPRSNTMKQGVHKHLLADALDAVDEALIYADTAVQWDINDLRSDKITPLFEIDEIINRLAASIRPRTKTHILIMSNGGFENLPDRLITRLAG